MALSGCAEQKPESESQLSTVDNTVDDIVDNIDDAVDDAVDNIDDTFDGVSVEIKGFAYNPATITVSKGTTVTWMQQDSAVHTVTSVSGNILDSKNLAKGQTFSYTFGEVGTFKYFCSNHPSMKGEVIVI